MNGDADTVHPSPEGFRGLTVKKGIYSFLVSLNRDGNPL